MSFYGLAFMEKCAKLQCIITTRNLWHLCKITLRPTTVVLSDG